MRLIDADAIREKHCDGCNADIKESCKTDPICATLMWVVDEPTIDAVPVVHGVWIRNLDDLFPLESYLECSICGNRQPIAIDENYCPHCGAKMEVNK